MHDRSEMGLYDETEVRLLEGLGIGTIRAVFQDSGTIAECRL
jgi:hypothetical protein